MIRTLVALFLLIMVPVLASAQGADKTLGLKLARVPEVVYAQVPVLKAGQGILVEDVVSGSWGEQAKLHRHDILLTLDGVSLNAPDQFSQILIGGKAPLPLVLFRGGKEMTLNLVSVPDGPTARFKPGGPPEVTVEAKPLRGNKMTITFSFFSKAGKLEKLTCTGSLEEIKMEVRVIGPRNNMSPPVQDLANLAIERLRVLNTPAKK